MAKEEWELSHLKALKEEEERRAELEEDEMLYTSLHYTAWKQQPGKKISLNVVDSFGDEIPVKRKSKAGRLSNATKRERMAQNETTLETSLSETWDSNGLGANFDDSVISSSSISTGSSLAYADSVDSVSTKLKKPIKRLKYKTSLAIKHKLHSKIGPTSTYKTKEKKKGLARPLKRGCDETSEVVFTNKKQKKNLSNAELSKSAANAASLMSSIADTVTAVATPPSHPKPRQSSVTKLLDKKCFISSHSQRIIVKRVGSEVAAISSSVVPKPVPPLPPASSRELFENKPIPILEKLGATVMTSPLNSAQLGPSRAPMILNSKAAAVNFPSHLHVSRLNQIVSSLSLSTLQNASLAQSAPGTIQYILRPSGMVTSGVRTDGVILANSTGGVQQAAVMQNPQGTSFVLLSQNLGKPNRLITPAVASQANKQNVLILPNAGKQNFIVTQQAGGNRQNFILIPNSVAQSNFVLTNASTGVAIPSPRVSVQTVGVAQPASRGVSSFPLLQTQPMQVTRRIIPPGLAVVSQQSIPVVQSCISNTVPILEKLAMQLGGASTTIVSPQQHRPRIVPSVAMVQQPTFKPTEMVLPARVVGHTSSSVVAGRLSANPSVVGQLSGSLVPRAAVAPVLAGRICSSVVTKQSPASLLANQPSNFITGRSASTAVLPRMPATGQSSGIVLTSKPVQPVNVTQFIVNQPRSTISVEKLTQLAVNGQLVIVDGRQTQDLITGRSLNPQTSGSNKK